MLRRLLLLLLPTTPPTRSLDDGGKGEAAAAGVDGVVAVGRRSGHFSDEVTRGETLLLLPLTLLQSLLLSLMMLLLLRRPTEIVGGRCDEWSLTRGEVEKSEKPRRNDCCFCCC